MPGSLSPIRQAIADGVDGIGLNICARAFTEVMPEPGQSPFRSLPST